MLAPEVWNFPPPRTCIQYYENDKHEKGPQLTIRDHYFNHSVCTLLPDVLYLPQRFSDIMLRDSQYYKLIAVPLLYFVDSNFIDGFVKSGEVTALSIDTCIDVDNCFALTPSGHLVLSLQRESFLKLGIDKGPAVNIISQSDFKQIHINLKEGCFIPGKRNYERVKNQLALAEELVFDVILAWEPSDSKVCPSSVAAYFASLGIETVECTPKEVQRLEYNIKIPPFLSSNCELLEWFGATCLGIKGVSDDPTEMYLSSYTDPEEGENVGQAKFVQWTGLFTSKRINRLFLELREYVSAHWVGMHVQGFDDSPVSWNLQPHHYFTSGENNYTFFLDPLGKIKTCKNFTSSYNVKKKKMMRR